MSLAFVFAVGFPTCRDRAPPFRSFGEAVGATRRPYHTPHLPALARVLHTSMMFRLLPFLIFLCGCASFHETSSTTPAPQSNTLEGRAPRAQDTHGYALLFELLGDEKNVSKLLIIKRERPELRDLIRDVAQRCGTAHEELERFAKADPALNLKTNGLPAVEVGTRDAIGKTKAKQLLNESGKEFELRLLIAQHEALTYGSHLAAAIAKAEANSQRAQFLRRLSSDLEVLENRVTSMLLANYNWPQQQR